jgi:RNA 2',3'-cyclic 3'-phosphodiesterase
MRIFVIMKKLFFAFRFEETDRNRFILQQLIAQLRLENIVWTDPANIHLTIKYLGDTADDKIPNIIETAKIIAENQNPFVIKARGVKIFGSSYNPKIIWANVEENKNIQDLYKHLQNALLPFNIEKDKQNFVPHITLGKIKQIKNTKSFQKLINAFRSNRFIKEEMKGFYLLESILENKKVPEYKTIAFFPFEN